MNELQKKSVRQRKRNIIRYCLYVESKKKSYELTYLQKRNRLIDLENELMARGKGGIEWESGVDRYTLLYLEWITNKDQLYSTGNSAQCYIKT